jgi:hypothetical protein
MKTFAEFEAAFLGALQQERSDLQGLQGATEAQLSAWIEHLFRQYLGYTHWKEISRGENTPIGSKGSKQLFPDLRIDVLDSGLIFVECKRLGRLDGSKAQEELDDGVSQLRSYIRAHLDRVSSKPKPVIGPKTVLGVVTDGNRWLMMGLSRTNEFHTIAEWAFLTDDPRLIAQRLWLLAKVALAQPTSAVVEFLARRMLVEVLKDNTKWLTRKVNEKLPDGTVSEELIGKWLRDAFSDPAVPPRLVPADAPAPPSPVSPQRTPEAGTDLGVAPLPPGGEPTAPPARRIGLIDLLNAGVIQRQDVLMVEGTEGRLQRAMVTPEGKIDVAGQVFDTVSPAAQRALELAGKTVKAVNGWSAFRVMRGGNYIGTLLQLRDQYDDREQEASGAGPSQDTDLSEANGPDPVVLAAVEQMKPLLDLLPELTVNTSRSTVSLYAGKLVVGYVFPRKRGLPRLRVYVGNTCPEWASPDTTYEWWCNVEDWSTSIDQVVGLLKVAPARRADDVAAGRDPYRRRSQPSQSTTLLTVEEPPPTL